MKKLTKKIVSIFAGIAFATSLSFGIAALTGSSRIVRVMPNTPALVGKGCSAFSGSEDVTEEEPEVKANRSKRSTQES